MKTKLIGLFVLAVIIASCNPGGQSKKFDYGHVEDNIYVNAFFGLEVLLPDAWVVQSKEQTENITNLGKDIIAGDDKNLKAVLDASEVNSANLLTVFKYEIGAAVDYNPSFMLVAENLNSAPGIKNGSDYLFQTKKLLQQSQMEFDHIDEQFAREVINNQEFDTMNCSISYMGFVIHQKYYTTIQNGFSLSVIVSFIDEEQRNDLEKVVNLMVFNK